MADHDTSDRTLGRIGAFSDGVFAFAITLLVVAIRISHPTDADAGRPAISSTAHVCEQARGRPSPGLRLARQCA
jgi:uncharacterized membrane protein